MELVDNDLPIDQKVIEAVEEALVEYLEPIKEFETVSLRKLYNILGIKFTNYRTGRLDKLILHTMLTWNWRMTEEGVDRSLITFKRRRHQTETRSIRLANGDFLLITSSYPLHRSDETDARHDVIRAKLAAARQARSQVKIERVE